ncbi:MAG: hypothetical protein ABEJ56_01230 [Candidatus Nanohaloarchaea archaeon]
MGRTMFKPGTILLFFIIAVFGYMLFTWSSGNINEIGETANRQQNKTFDCAGIETEFVRVESSGSNVSVFFRINRKVEKAAAKIVGDRNVTENYEDVPKSSLQKIYGNVGDFRYVRVTTGRCDQVFEYSG